MKYNIKDDLKYYQEITGHTDQKIANALNISRMSLHRLFKNSMVSTEMLEDIYSFMYKEGVRINRTKEELY